MQPCPIISDKDILYWLWKLSYWLWILCVHLRRFIVSNNLNWWSSQWVSIGL